MSRHNLVKALDLEDELDDFDGGAESDYDEYVSNDDKGTLIVLLEALVCVDCSFSPSNVFSRATSLRNRQSTRCSWQRFIYNGQGD